MTPILPEDSGQDQNTTDLWNVLFRRQQLQNRLKFLKEVQKRNNRAEVCVSSDEGPSELERIEEELNLLEKKEKELIQKKSNQICSSSVTIQSTGPIQGLYVLPISPTETVPYSFVQEEETEQPNTAEPVLEVHDLILSPAKVKCPSCKNVVTTEIHYNVGSSAFLLCCLLSVVGCLAGCCLVPFCVNHFKDVTHRCPSCHRDVCTVNRI